MSSLTAAETFNQGYRLFSGFLMLRGSSAHSINDRPSFQFPAKNACYDLPFLICFVYFLSGLCDESVPPASIMHV